MNPHDFPNIGPFLHAFTEAVCSYANLRGYVADRHGDPDPDITGWLRSKSAVYVDPQDITESEPWESSFYGAWWEVRAALDAWQAEWADESDEITAANYEDALIDDQAWAVEAHDHRSSVTDR